jgi:hypothetical protein
MVTTPRKVTSGVAANVAVDAGHLKHKRRFCRHEGCNRIVKSQGLCQRHGAKVRQCIVEGCKKGAQGNFDKMCKSHFKQMKRQTTPLPKVVPGKPPSPPEGKSVYDEVLPNSIGFTARRGAVMPLVAHLKAGFDSLKPPAWHRNEERRARGMYTVENPATQLEGWERELVWMEILVLTGAPGASFRHLARAWGRDKGFHMVLAQFICERQGDVQRKKRIAEKEEAAMKFRGPAKKRRRLKTIGQSDAEISADVWDDSAYSDPITNEALAADIFDFSAQEFESATALQRWRLMEDAANSDTASIGSQRSTQAAATQAILGDVGNEFVAKPPSLEVPEHHLDVTALATAPAGSQYTGDVVRIHQHAVQQSGQYSMDLIPQSHQQVQYQQHTPPEYLLGQPTHQHQAQFQAQQHQVPQYQHQGNNQQYGLQQPQVQQQQYGQLYDQQNPQRGLSQQELHYDSPPASERYMQQQQRAYDTHHAAQIGQVHFQQQMEPPSQHDFQRAPPGVSGPRSEHPEQNPETSALPPELAHPPRQYAHHQQQQQQQQQQQHNSGY